MVFPHRNNPYIPCGEHASWVMSQFGHMVVLDQEHELSDLRRYLIGTTVVLGALQLIALVAIRWYWLNVRRSDYGDRKRFIDVASVLLLLCAAGRYFHFVDNHSRSAAYHDCSIVYCGWFLGDTDGFIPFQIVHIALSLVAANEVFQHYVITPKAYAALMATGTMASISYLHFIVEPPMWYGVWEIASILCETLPASATMLWTHYEWSKQHAAATTSSYEDVDTIPLMDRGHTTVRRRSKDIA